MTARKSGGFTLVGVVVAIAILTILIAAVGPTIATIVQRDKEIELIFRGKQYARAILAFQKRFGRYPNKLEELGMSRPRSIRQMWIEPLCNCEDGWQVIIAGTPEAMPMGQGAVPPGGTAPGPGLPRGRTTPGSGNQPPSTYTGFGEPTPPPFLGGGAAPTPTPAPFSTGIFAQKGPEVVGPIVGVRSKRHQKAVREWREKSYTDEWRFIAGDADNDSQMPYDPNTLRGPRFLTPSPRP